MEEGVHTDPFPPCCPPAALAAEAEAEGSEVGSVEQQRKQQGYFVRLGSLSTRLRHLAYEHSLGKLRQKKHHAQDTLAQLQETLELVRALCLPHPVTLASKHALKAIRVPGLMLDCKGRQN